MRNFIVTIDGKSYQVGVEEVGSTAAPAPVVNTVSAAPAPAAAPAAPAPAPAPKAPAPKAAPANGTPLASPFPGLIKSLLVEEGATVKKDQPLLVLEAMKMDNDITSPCDGVVTFRVSKGSNVETDTVLAIIS